jgi:hypothetical protein
MAWVVPTTLMEFLRDVKPLTLPAPSKSISLNTER